MRQSAEVLTAWAVNPKEGDSNWPALLLAYPDILMFRDVTNQLGTKIPSDPSQYCVYIEAGDTVMSQIEADTDYGVLWVEDIPEETI